MITNLAGAPSAQLQMKMHITQCDINIVKPQQCAAMYVAADRHAPEQAQTHFSRQMQQLNFPAFSNSPILATTHADFGRHSCLTVRLHVRTVTIDYGCSHRRAPRSWQQCGRAAWRGQDCGRPLRRIWTPRAMWWRWVGARPPAAAKPRGAPPPCRRAGALRRCNACPPACRLEAPASTLLVLPFQVFFHPSEPPLPPPPYTLPPTPIFIGVKFRQQAGSSSGSASHIPWGWE